MLRATIIALCLTGAQAFAPARPLFTRAGVARFSAEVDAAYKKAEVGEQCTLYLWVAVKGWRTEQPLYV
jgi:hypothetical protein